MVERLRLTSIIKGTKSELLADEEIRANSIMYSETDSGKVKFADGIHNFADLPYVVGELDEAEGAVYRFKGSVEKYEDLPKDNNRAGDTYDVKELGHNYSWTEDGEWDDIGGTIDLSGYATLDDLTEDVNVLDNKIIITNQHIDREIENINSSLDDKANINDVYTQEECDNKFLTEHQDISNKQDVIPDLDEIRNGANLGSTSVQPATLESQVAALTQQIKDLKLLIPQEVFDPTTARSAMNASGKVTLCEDINLGVLNIGGGMFANYNTSINLNGHTLQSGPTGGRALLLVRGTSNYTFNGDGQVIDTADDSSPVWCASENGSVTINNGTFIAQGHTETIYCELGTITINGGEFKCGTDDKRYLLNCKDANYQSGKAKIIVKGGKFWDFDPHNNTAEGAGTNFCADGYTTTSEEIDGHTVYTVVKA